MASIYNKLGQLMIVIMIESPQGVIVVLVVVIIIAVVVVVIINVVDVVNFNCDHFCHIPFF